MKKYLTLAIIFALVTSPFIVQALSVPLNRTIRGAEQLGYPSDSLLVGASATTTTAKLEVSGNLYATGNITCGGSCGGSGTQTPWAQNINGGGFTLTNTGHVGIGTTTATELLTIDRPASDNDYSTLLTESGAVKGIVSASTPDLAVFVGSKSAHPLSLVTSNSSRLAITSGGAVQFKSNDVNWNTGGDSATSNYKVYQTSDGYLQAQRSGGADDEFSIFDLEAPTADPIESTLTTGLNTGANRNWIDWTDEAYATDNAGSINIGAKGTATVQPFVIRFWPKTTYTHVHDIPTGTWFDPSGAVAFGYGSTTPTTGNPYRYDYTIPLQVASSTATTVFAVDAAQRTHLFIVNGNGNVAVGTSTPTNLFQVEANSDSQIISSTQNFSTGVSAVATQQMKNDVGAQLNLQMFGSQNTTTQNSYGSPFSLAGFGRFRSSSAANGFVISTGGAKPLVFATSDTEVARFDSSGHFGIGTSSPSNALEVVGTSYFTNTMTQKSATNAQINQDRNATTNTALNVYRTAGTDEWSVGLRNDSTNTFHVRDAVNSADAFTILQGTSPKVGVSSSTPYATLSVQSGASTGDAFAVATSSGAAVFGIDNDGHRFTSGPVPVLSSCGTGSPTITGDDQTGTITTGTAATSCTMTFAKAFRKTPVCNFNDDSSTIPGDISAISTTAVTFALGAGLSGGHLYYSCAYHQ